MFIPRIGDVTIAHQSQRTQSKMSAKSRSAQRTLLSQKESDAPLCEFEEARFEVRSDGEQVPVSHRSLSLLNNINTHEFTPRGKKLFGYETNLTIADR